MPKKKNCNRKKNQRKKRRALLIGRGDLLLLQERMILPKEFYDLCCPTYQKAIDELEKKLADNGAIRSTHEIYDEASGNEWLADFEIKRKKFFDTIFDFEAKYLIPKEYWEYVMHYFDEVISDYALEDRQNFSRGFAKIACLRHLYYNHAWNSIDCTPNVDDGHEHFLKAYDGERFKLLEFQMNHYLQQRSLYLKYDATEQDLQYPHDRLQECFREYERRAIRQPSDKLVKQFGKMKTLFSKIKAAEGNVEEWFKLLTEAGDDIFVINNVECRFGLDLLDVKLWKMYLTFLKEHGYCNKLVKMYSKYCRFFLEDLDMLEEFKAELAKHGKADVPLDKMYFLNVIEVVEKEDVTQDDEIVPFDKSLCSTFYDSAQNQIFSLPIPLICYIVENANHRVLRKLFKSCKYCFAKRPTPICYRLTNGCETRFNGESLSLRHTTKLESHMNKTWITGIIGTGYAVPIGTAFNHAFISNVIPRIYRCEAKYISLFFQRLTFDELKFLIQHGGVVEINYNYCIMK